MGFSAHGRNMIGIDTAPIMYLLYNSYLNDCGVPLCVYLYGAVERKYQRLFIPEVVMCLLMLTLFKLLPFLNIRTVVEPNGLRAIFTKI